jgi:protein-tyrosine phosphatase
MHTHRTRHVALAGPRNFRDLGGYPIPNGSTRWGRIYRADALTQLSQDDQATLVKRGLATVVDLRFEREILAEPNAFRSHATVGYHHNPMLTDDPTSAGDIEQLRTLDFAAFNIDMIRNSSQTFAYLFHLLGQPSAYPLAFNCRGGRDRTGVAAALVLSAAGVARDVVLEDYTLSNDLLAPWFATLSDSLRTRGIDPDPIMANVHLRAAYLTPMLDTLQADFGGIDGYLHQIGVTADDLATFRNHFLSDE